MLKTIAKLFGLKPKLDFNTLVKQGAVILDVRSKNEYANGHIQGSINISVDILQSNLNKLKDKNKPIITCCASGRRSESAKHILKLHGFVNVYNAGGWQSLQNKMS